MSRKPPVILSLIGAMILASCGDSVLGPSDLQGEWRLREVTPAGAATVSISIEDSARFTVGFGADGAVGVRAD